MRRNPSAGYKNIQQQQRQQNIMLHFIWSKNVFNNNELRCNYIGRHHYNVSMLSRSYKDQNKTTKW